MTRISGLFTAALIAFAAPEARAETLDLVRDRGSLVCGVNTGLVGFAALTVNEVWEGFYVDHCRAIAAAIFGDPTRVEFIPLPSAERFDALAAGEVDLLSGNATWTFARDVGRSFEFTGVIYYDGLGLMVPTALGVASAKELDVARICVQAGTSTEPLSDFFGVNNIAYTLLTVETRAEAQERYLAGDCSTYADMLSILSATRATFELPNDHILLPEVISKEPLGPIVRHGDSEWGDLVRWVHNALIAAEELGVTSANVSELGAVPTSNPEVNRLLGTDGNLGAMLGLSPDWAVNAILAGGNYGEIFEKNIGQNTPIGLPRGLNALWTDGGLQYALPFR